MFVIVSLLFAFFFRVAPCPVSCLVTCCTRGEQEKEEEEEEEETKAGGRKIQSMALRLPIIEAVECLKHGSFWWSIVRLIITAERFKNGEEEGTKEYYMEEQFERGKNFTFDVSKHFQKLFL